MINKEKRNRETELKIRSSRRKYVNGKRNKELRQEAKNERRENETVKESKKEK